MQAIARPLTRAAPRGLRQAAALSTWSAVPAGPPDPILREQRFKYKNTRVELRIHCPGLRLSDLWARPLNVQLIARAPSRRHIASRTSHSYTRIWQDVTDYGGFE